MAQARSSGRNRWSLIASVLMIGFISLVQPGCNCGSSSGTAAPAPVATVFPSDQSDTALVGTVVAVNFLNPMNSSTINEDTFTLSTGGTPVSGTVVTPGATSTTSATFIPDSDLVSGTEYRATISSAVTDINGNHPLSSDYVWSFLISQATVLTSKDINSVAGVDVSSLSAIDKTGRFIVFESEATNLSSAITTFNRNHIYRKDTLTGEVLLVSSDANGLEANNSSSSPRISDDGQHVVFASTATNLSSISTGGTKQIFIKHLTDGSIELVSTDSTGLVAANNSSENPDVSNDGGYVVFESDALNLSGLTNNGVSQIYLKNMTDESVDMISRDTTQSAGGTGDSNRPAMSPDARYIVYDSIAGNSLVIGATAIRHVFLVDMESADVTEQISVNSSSVQGNGNSINASVSDDGNYVAFESNATNLITGGTLLSDIYRRDRSGSETLLASTPDATTSGDNASINSSISGDGTFVAFESASTNLVTEVVAGLTDIFVRDFSTTPTVTIEKINLSQSGAEATNNSNNASISSDGRYVSFDSAFNYDVTDTNTINDVYRSHNSTF